MNKLSGYHSLGLATMLFGKLMDLATTVIGLSISGIQEANAAAASTYGAFGPAGLVVYTLIFIAAVILVVEWMAVRVDPEGPSPTGLRATVYSTYWILGLAWLGVATHNIMLVSAHIAGGVMAG